MICQELYNNVVIYISFFLWNIISLKLFITMPTIETFSWTMIQHILNGPLRPSTSMFTKGSVASNMQNLVVYLLGFALLHLSEVWFYSSCLFFFYFPPIRLNFNGEVLLEDLLALLIWKMVHIFHMISDTDIPMFRATGWRDCHRQPHHQLHLRGGQQVPDPGCDHRWRWCHQCKVQILLLQPGLLHPSSIRW